MNEVRLLQKVAYQSRMQVQMLIEVAIASLPTSTTSLYFIIAGNPRAERHIAAQDCQGRT
jgi:hypothetical protein